MEWGNSELFDRFSVFFGGISLVAFPVVLRVLLRQFVHVVITVGLRQDAGGSNGKILTIPLYNGGMGEVTVFFELIAIYDDIFGTQLELIERPVHGEDTGVENIDFVDFIGGDDAYSPCQGIPLHNLTQGITPFFGELFRVVELIVHIIFRQYHGGGIHAARQTTATSFIAASLNQIG